MAGGCWSWKRCGVTALALIVFLALSMFTGVWILRESASCSSPSSLLIFPSCLNIRGATLESLLDGSNSQQIVDLLRKHVKDEKVELCLLKDILLTILQSSNSIDSPGVDAGRPGRHPLELELPRQGVQLQMQQKDQREKHQSTGIVAQVLLFFRRILDV